MPAVLQVGGPIGYNTAMRKPTSFTHRGVHCDECTNSNSVHANNVHLITRKGIQRWVPCPEGCSHPISDGQRG